MLVSCVKGLVAGCAFLGLAWNEHILLIHEQRICDGTCSAVCYTHIAEMQACTSFGALFARDQVNRSVDLIA